MLKKLTSVNEYMDFVNEINSTPDFSNPMLSSKEQIQCNLLDALNKPMHQIWGIFEKEEIVGLFVFLILEDESYIEMLVGLSRVLKTYEEMLAFLKEKYKGYRVDFVYNPDNHLLHNLLQNEQAEFEAEQQKMLLKEAVSYKSDHQIELFNPKYKEQYILLHSNGGYWTADKVIDASDRFRIFLAIENNEVVGYTDVTYQYDVNEPYDIFVKEKYRNKGYGKAMLAKAVELNKPKDMMLLVDANDFVSITLFESLGFVRAVAENSITAHVLL